MALPPNPYILPPELWREVSKMRRERFEFVYEGDNLTIYYCPEDLERDQFVVKLVKQPNPRMVVWPEDVRDWVKRLVELFEEDRKETALPAFYFGPSYLEAHFDYHDGVRFRLATNDSEHFEFTLNTYRLGLLLDMIEIVARHLGHPGWEAPLDRSGLFPPSLPVPPSPYALPTPLSPHSLPWEGLAEESFRLLRTEVETQTHIDIFHVTSGRNRIFLGYLVRDDPETPTEEGLLAWAAYVRAWVKVGGAGTPPYLGLHYGGISLRDAIPVLTFNTVWHRERFNMRWTERRFALLVDALLRACRVMAGTEEI